MKKSRVALLLVLCLALLTACGGNGNTPSEPDTQEDTHLNEVYSAYMKELEEKRDDILLYNWQKGFSFDEDLYEEIPNGDTDAVAFLDVWGDETPEMIYICATRFEGNKSYSAEVHVFSFKDGELTEIYKHEELDALAGGGMSYRLFTVNGEKNLWIYEAHYSEELLEIYSQLSTDDSDGAMTAQHTCTKRIWWDYDPETDVETDTSEWYLDSIESTEEEYEAAIPSEEDQKDGLVMRNLRYYEYSEDADYAEETVYPQKGLAMTYDEAISYLREKLGITLDMTVDETAFFESLPDFSFSSGVGGWSTDIYIEPDGTFTGYFHDSELGMTGDDYPYGSIYVCDFNGRFGEVTRVDEYTYSMKLLELNVGKTEGEEWIEDGVRYIVSYPYGLENADEMTVYLPGAQMSKLPLGFKDWVRGYDWYETGTPPTLPFYGLYNVADEYGFAQSSD